MTTAKQGSCVFGQTLSKIINRNFNFKNNYQTLPLLPFEAGFFESPSSPRIEIAGDLKENEPVTITCSAFIPCPYSPPKLTWNLQQDPHNRKEKNTDQTFTAKIQKTITLSDTHDGFNITCWATYLVNDGRASKTAQGRKTLCVLYAPKDTSASISPTGLVSAGSWVNLTCSSRAKPTVSNFTWFKISKDGPMNIAKGDLYSFNVTDGGVYFCVATNDLGEQTSSKIHVTMKGVPDGALPWGAVLGGIIGIIVFICLVVCVYTLICWKRLKLTRSTQQQSQRQTGEELTATDAAKKNIDENIHYGEIVFSKQRPGPSSDSVQDNGQQQDTVYAQVKVYEPANRSTHAAVGPEDLYAQVKNN